jgi:hypothetical protein
MVRLLARFKEGDETDIERDRMESETILLFEGPIIHSVD